MKDYDAIVIGTGQAGPYVTSRLAGAGMKVAVIERNVFGGTCVNTGCIPTKTMSFAYSCSVEMTLRQFLDLFPLPVKARRELLSSGAQLHPLRGATELAAPAATRLR